MAGMGIDIPCGKNSFVDYTIDGLGSPARMVSGSCGSRKIKEAVKAGNSVVRRDLS